MAEAPLNVLLLCNRTTGGADARTVTDHLDAFTRYSRHRMQPLSFLRELPAGMDLCQFDAIIIHYTIAIGWLSEHYMSPATAAKIRDFPGLKVLFIQDEYRAVRQLHAALRHMGIDLLFSCVPQGEVEKVYPSSALPGMKVISTLTGFVPETLTQLSVAPIAQRPVDVGYRTRKYPYWLGQLAYEKWQIAERFARHAEGSGLRLDLSHVEGERLYGSRWIGFIAGCKCVLGVESGSSVFDFDGSVQQQVEEYVAAHPAASFEEVQRRFLAPHEGRVDYAQIAPRCFEAAALRTVMVLYEGRYSGVLHPWRHYIPLRRDFSNFQEVTRAIRDPSLLQTIADRAYQEVACNPAYSYRSFIDRIDDEIVAEFARRRKRRAEAPYRRSRYLLQLLRSPMYLLNRAHARVFQWLLLAPGRRPLMMRIWTRIPPRERERIRPLVRRLLGR